MEKIKLEEVTNAVLAQMETSGFKEKTRKFYVTLFNRLERLAKEKGELYYSVELGEAFIADDTHITPENSKRYHTERTMDYIRVIKFIEIYLMTGQVDWSASLGSALFPLKHENLKKEFQNYLEELKTRELKQNTIDGYRRFTYYFLEYLESKKYLSTLDIKKGDILAFISLICSEKYQPTSLGAHLPGLKIFLHMSEYTKQFISELPQHLPKKREILKIYNDEEYERILNYLNETEHISLRNKALTILALDTGLRAVDICGLKLSDIEWEHNRIQILQQKTGHMHSIILSERIGNALVDYILNERPVVKSDSVFLQAKAPFNPLMSHAGIRNILFQVVNDADIEANGRIYGTRITRHSTASRMLRHGIPLPVISEALGHGNPNSVMIYLTTDDAKLAECTLPLPGGKANES